MPALTLGQRANQPQGRKVEIAAPFPESVFATLSALAPEVETWWSVHRWNDDYRSKDAWRESIGVAVDVDYHEADAPPPGLPDRLLAAARGGQIPGTIFHLTPHGARVVFVYEIPCAHREMQIAASKGAGALVEQALRSIGLADDYVVDKCTWDLGRLFFAHNAIAKGVRRVAELVMMRDKPFSADDLAAHEPAPAPAPTAAALPVQTVARIEESFVDRVKRWVLDHSRPYPKALSDCPICGHRDCFKVLPEDERRWFCFSTNHTGVGIESEGGHHGDAMDIECHRTGLEQKEILRRDGYLAPPRAVQSSEPTPIRPPVVEPTRVWKNRSLLTCLGILRKNARDVLRGRKLELNALTGESELGRVPVEDADVTEIRGRIEQLFSGGTDKDGNERGMQQSKSDVCDAVDQIARENSYNPLREYLESLKWDGVERVNAVCEDVLGAERTQINQAIVRNFFVSAVARALEPGCQVHTVMVLVGGQGAGKSTFFRVLGGQWFADSAVDIKDKDSFQNLRGSWIYEWAELEALNRARDSSAAKAFLSSAVDRYRPSYGRRVVNVPRSCVIVGSTNRNDFLEDETGNRRFWPLRVGEVIDTAALRAQRDQLWAEAIQIYRTTKTWHLDRNDSLELAVVQKAFESKDVWASAVLALDYDNNDYTSGDVLKLALKKELDTWTRSDEMRVAKILRQAGYETFRPHRGNRVWKRQ